MNDATVIVADGKIQSIARGTPAPAGATVIDVAGHYLLPGFIDGHTHIGDIDSGRRAVRSGATTVRTLGVDHFADLGMRELNHAGVADVPDVIGAGYHVRPRPSNDFFLDIPQMADLLGPGVRGPENLRRMVKALAARGVNVIKVMATERAGLPDTTPRVRVFTDEELAAIVDEASRANLKVAAHAHGDEGANAAVRAGVHTIEHGTWMSDDTLRLMKEKGVYLSPTLTATHDLQEPGGDYDNPILQMRGRAMLPRAQEMVRRAWGIGVKIIASTDTGYLARSNERITDEMINLADCGVPAAEAIKAGTSVAAEALGVANRTGSIRVGFEADLVVVDRNPLEDIRNIRDVLVVVNNGKVVLNDFNIAPR
jgi:imidazolonepropionase-like amidohydrolase